MIPNSIFTNAIPSAVYSFILLPLHILHVYKQWVCNPDSNSKLLDLPRLNLQLLNQLWSVASAELLDPDPKLPDIWYYIDSLKNITREASYSLDLQTHAESGSRDAAL